MTNPIPEAPPRCRACGADLAPGAERCDRCGTSQRVDECPHCGATAGVSPDSELRFRCDVCGGPRVPPVPRGKRSGREVAPLQRAQAVASARTRWRAATVAGGLLLGFDMLLLSLVLLISGLSFGLLLAGLVTTVPLAGFVLWALGRARARGREIGPALDAAWLAAATDVASQAEGAMTARDLATALGVGEAQAEELLALLEVNDVVRGAMTAGGEMAYAPRFRIAGKPGAEAEPVAIAAAEQEAIAVDEAAAEERRRAADAGPTKA